MGGPSSFFVVPTVELLAVETARVSTGLTNPTAENQRVDELKLECTKCWAEPDFFDFRILARMKAPNAMMLSPEFFVERTHSRRTNNLSSGSYVTAAAIVQKRKESIQQSASAFSDVEQGWM